ncbi:MAG: RidA family protein, partial [Alphaproteobacteria bacterium]|nr:RidA family protein [Alphaproteobacteria bacterium]
MIAGALAPVAPFSHAVEVGEWIFVTWQLPIDPVDPKRALPKGIEAQTRLVFANLTTVLEACGTTLANVVMARVYLTHFYRDYQPMNRVYASYFRSTP